jgi:enoyl-CoA hydratase/carnithine racemase
MIDTTPSDRSACRATRVRILLTLAQSFTPAQVADLMATASRWGADEAYERGFSDGDRCARAEVASLNLAAIRAALDTPPVTERWIRMETYRARARHDADTAAGHAWRTDHPGGAMPDWEMPEAGERAETLTAALRTLPRVYLPAVGR